LTSAAAPQAAGGVGKLTVARFYRPEDVSREQAYQAGFWELFASEEAATLDADEVFGKCAVVPAGAPAGAHQRSTQAASAGQAPDALRRALQHPGVSHLYPSDLAVKSERCGAGSASSCAHARRQLGCRPADVRRARAGDNTFVCTRSYCRKSGEFGEPPAELRPAAAPLAGKGKGKAATAAPVPEAVEAGAACAPAPCLTA